MRGHAPKDWMLPIDLPTEALKWGDTGVGSGGAGVEARQLANLDATRPLVMWLLWFRAAWVVSHLVSHKFEFGIKIHTAFDWFDMRLNPV